VDDLIAFIVARLDEDEEDAREAMDDLDGNWSYVDTPGGNHKVTDSLGYSVNEHYDVNSQPWFTGRHIARHDPARSLREVEADRQLLAACQRAREAQPSDSWESDYTQALEDAVRIRGGVWSDHPDYRPKWAP
jgi:Family of unknown function (DUF6221)